MSQSTAGDKDTRDSITGLQGEVRVPGPTYVGQLVTPDDPRREDAILLVETLELRDYTAVVQSRAIVCENCEPTSHIAIVCRILGIPVLIVNAALRYFTSGQQVTVDTPTGRVFLSDTKAWQGADSIQEVDTPTLPAGRFRYQLSIVAEPGLIGMANAKGRSDIEQYFLREELIWVAHQRDPFSYLESEGSEAVTSLLVDALAPLAAELARGQRLNYRALDIRSDQRHHFGTNSHHEPNPQLGLHGIRQLLQTPTYIEAELRAVDTLYARGSTSIVYSLPFLTLEDELSAVLKLRDAVCNYPVQIGVFVETPAATLELPFLLRQGLASVYVGTKDLTQLILATDRENAGVAHLLDANARPVLAAIGTILATCTAADVPVFVFTFAENLAFIGERLPDLHRVSLPATDYIRAA